MFGQDSGGAGARRAGSAAVRAGAPPADAAAGGLPGTATRPCDPAVYGPRRAGLPAEAAPPPGPSAPDSAYPADGPYPPDSLLPPDGSLPSEVPSAPDITPDDLPDGLVVADQGGRVVCFNAAAARITGLRPEDVLGRPIAEALPLEDLEGRRWWALTDPYGGLRTRVGQPERNLLLPGGHEVLVSARYVRTHPRGPVRRLVVALRGTEARRRTERSHAELIATVAHELRSPLTSVKGFTATLLAKWERFNDDQKRLMLETVDADANRVTRLIAELLDISRIDAGRLEVRRQKVDIAAAVRRHVEGHIAAGQRTERFVVRVDPDLPDLWADADKIDQILGNLLENAVRHGEGRVTIDVDPVVAAPPAPGAQALPGTPAHGAPAQGAAGRATAVRAAGGAHPRGAAGQDVRTPDRPVPGPSGQGPCVQGTAVTVSDEGPGIPEESMNRVFTRFWRGSKRGGTGLGLYIVKGLIEAHGGDIAVGRAPGGGAQFRFTLPVGTPAALV